MDSQVDVVVVSYNTRDLLLECLASVVESAKSHKVRVVVVDNASEDRSIEAVRRNFPNTIVIGNETNVGFGAACNQAIRLTDSPLILLLNSDARLSPEALKVLCACLEQNEQCGAAGCRLIDPEGVEETNTRNFLTPINQPLELAGIHLGSASRRTKSPKVDSVHPDCSPDWITAACLMLKRAAINETGLFDEQFFMYSEDEDLCFRLKQVGWSVCYCGDATAIHHGGASSKLNKDEKLRQFYRSQILFMLKHRGRRSAALFAVLMKIVLALKRLLSRSGPRRDAASAHLKAFGEAWRNTWRM